MSWWETSRVLLFSVISLAMSRCVKDFLPITNGCIAGHCSPQVGRKNISAGSSSVGQLKFEMILSQVHFNVEQGLWILSPISYSVVTFSWKMPQSHCEE